MRARAAAALLVLAIAAPAQAAPPVPGPKGILEEVGRQYGWLTKTITDVCYQRGQTGDGLPEKVCVPMGDEVHRVLNETFPGEP